MSANVTVDECCDCGDYPNGPLRRAEDCPHHRSKPLFIPLKTVYFEAFKSGKKTVEYRRYGLRWNERTCRFGRRVVLSKGYGKAHRLNGRIVGFQRRYMQSAAWLACYGTGDVAACIRIEVER